ncbi:methionyl-tRNA formyltransferase [Thermocrinis minervae]|uniref:Methionyl-tRNA formyltransferase n=1 Tax=Thermocrinis minervae TaxID=381751 RepID=A0A1M6QD93_9AQUI|nr:methionyl-tRNA formyltransferase [Thermocrinis minervae]SHK18156.1 methionyl-tRNA formyltransferase [Thermocrinis minervae]
MSLRVLFMGTSQFAVPSLKKAFESFQVVGLVCQPDRPAGRGLRLTPPPTKRVAQELGLEIFQPERKKDLLPIVEKTKPELILVVSYGMILPKEVLDFPKYGCLNLHASLLPLYRGASPIQRSLMAGEEKTGNTVILMDEGMDTGPILSQEEEPIREEDNLSTLSERLAIKGSELLIKTAMAWVEGSIKPVEQDEKRATYAPPVQKEEFRICWKATASSVRDRIRGLYPNTYCYLESGERIKILKASVLPYQGEPGQVIDDRDLLVACGEDSLLVEELITPKGKRVSGKDFIKGYKVKYLY